MKSVILVSLAMLTLSACKEDETVLPLPVGISAGTVGYYCQMELVNHDGPKGQIHLDGAAEPIFFAQVRDTIAYLHMPEQSHAVQVAYVQDMATAPNWAEPGAWIAADKALFVVGSNRMGGMGAPELVPFSDRAAAERFVASHGGTVLRLDQIRPQDVLANAAQEKNVTDQADIANRLRALAPADRTN